MEEKLSELRNGDPRTQGVLEESLFQAIRDMVLQDVDKKVAEKAEELWQKGKQMLSQIQTKQKEKNLKLVEEVAKCHEKQRALEAENEKLKQVLQGLAARFSLLGQVFTGKDAVTAPTGTPENATSMESTEFTPPQAQGSASDSADSVAKLPDVPPWPFPGQSPSPAAPLSLAEALGTQTPQRTPLSLVNSLTPTPATTEASPSTVAGGATTFSFTLRKADGADLGLNVSHEETDQVLQVEGVRADGAVEAWNRQCASSDKAVVPGDRIISVNNISFDPQKMLEECRDKVLLKLTVVRGDGPVTAAPPKALPPNKTTLRADASVFVPMTGAEAPAAGEEPEEAAAQQAEPDAATREPTDLDAASPSRGGSPSAAVAERV
jgi:hypothetical protein